jgi:hypothetical protein
VLRVTIRSMVIAVNVNQDMSAPHVIEVSQSMSCDHPCICLSINLYVMWSSMHLSVNQSLCHVTIHAFVSQSTLVSCDYWSCEILAQQILFIIIIADKTLFSTECSSCKPNICLNGGTCGISRRFRVWFCRCAPGFRGIRCEIGNMFYLLLLYLQTHCN